MCVRGSSGRVGNWSKERNVRKKETWKFLKAKQQGEQMSPHLEMTDSPFCVTRRKNSDFVALRSLNSPQAGQAMHMPSGLTQKSWFTLSYGSAAACKVEKNPRKTKVYEWLNSPVAC